VVPLDFTYRAFEEFCQLAAQHSVFTVADALSLPVLPSAFSLILRLDVDYREAHAVDLASIAQRHHLTGSFYFRQHGGQFDLDAMRAVAALGHEIGYHFETLDTCRGDFAQAESLFLENLQLLRAAGFTIRTVAAHGAVPTAPTYHANLDLFTRAPDLFARAGLLGETTLSVDFARLIYCSDADWRWRRYEHRPPTLTAGTPVSLRAIMAELAGPVAALYLNFHPQQWFARPLTMLSFRARNRIGRRVLPAIHRR
jgi:hypothetical protein